MKSQLKLQLCFSVLTLIPCLGFGENLDLKAAMIQALSHNLDVKVSTLTVQEKRASIMRAQGEFDLNFTSKATRDHSETPSTSSLEGVATEVVSDSTSLTTTLSQKFYGGLELSMPLTYSINESNSIYARLPEEHNTSAGIALKQPLLKGFDTSYGKREILRADWDLQAAREKHGEKLEDTVLKAAELFLDALRDIETIRVREMAFKTASESEEFVKAKKQLGKASTVDVLEAEVARGKTEEALLSAKATAAAKRDEMLAHVFGSFPENLTLRTDLEIYLVKPQTFNLNEAIKSASAKRHELTAAKASLAKAKSDVNFATTDLKSNLDLKASFTNKGMDNDFSDSTSQVTKGDHSSWSTSLEFERPLNRYAANGAYTSKKLQLEQQKIKLAQLERDLILDLRRYSRQVESNWQRLQALEHAVTAQRERMKAQQARFKSGKLSITELNRALQDSESTEIDFIKARLSYVKSHLQLSAATGQLFTQQGIVSP